MTKKMPKFALMNVLIKGTPSAIKNALSKIDSEYELKESTYNPKKVKEKDTTIVKAGIVFEEWYEGFVTPDEIPFASIPDIKFIGLGNGGDGSRGDGSYVFYKDFGEVSVTECYRFSATNPQMEEFDGQYDVLKSVRNSFMDHPWMFRYEDYSCGEYCPWSFGNNKDKKLIAKWKSDEIGNNKKEKR